MTIISISSGIRGGVGKSLVATVTTFTFNYLYVKGEIDAPTLLVDAGGGATRFVLPLEITPPFTRDLARTFDAIAIVTFTHRIERKRFLRRPEVEEHEISFYVTPEIRELSEEEIEDVVKVLPKLEDYFEYIIIDLPAVSARYYWRFLDVTDVQIVCMTPEPTVYTAILQTNIIKTKVVAVVNKFDEKRESHRRALEEIQNYFSRYPGSRVVTIPYDPILEMAGVWGLEYLLKFVPSNETAKGLASLIGAIEELASGEERLDIYELKGERV